MAFRWWKPSAPSEQTLQQQAQRYAELVSGSNIPTLWLFGKTGSGKSSVVRLLTGAQRAVIGEGYRPQTRTSDRFDFPSIDDPLWTFLDTRGLAEAGYDPAEDIAKFSGSTQLMIVTVRVADHALQSVIDPLREIRRRAPDRPVLLVLTCLHEATAAIDLTEGIDPFDPPAGAAPADQMREVPAAVTTLIEQKKRQFQGLFDELIPVDLTPVEDGFADPEFGGDRLKHAILKRLPHAYRQAVLALSRQDAVSIDQRQRQARNVILSMSALAATTAAVPVPWLDVPGVLAIQSHLTTRIAKIHGKTITPSQWKLISGTLGSHVTIQLVLRGAVKFIPVAGSVAAAAGSFAITYAIGWSCDWYFSSLDKGLQPTAEQMSEVFASQLRRGRELWNAS